MEERLSKAITDHFNQSRLRSTIVFNFGNFSSKEPSIHFSQLNTIHHSIPSFVVLEDLFNTNLIN
jgi:hypothetical protein